VGAKKKHPPKGTLKGKWIFYRYRNCTGLWFVQFLKVTAAVGSIAQLDAHMVVENRKRQKNHTLKEKSGTELGKSPCRRAAVYCTQVDI